MPRLLLAPLFAAVCTAGGSDPRATPPMAALTTPSTATAAPDRAAAPDAVVEAPGRPVEGPAGGLTSLDACPDQAETRNGFQDDDGCADAVPTELAEVLGVVTGIVFELEKDIIRLQVARPVLDRLVEVLARHPGVVIEVAVHSDLLSESDRYSRCLTCKRAEAIAAYLIQHGIDRGRVIARGYADSRPIASHKTAAGRRQNRRVEISLVSTGVPVATAAACIDQRTLRGVGGEQHDCYPYLCRAGACLKRCEHRRDCAGAQEPSELATMGWPLECMPSGECTPMPPDKVH